MSKIPNPGSPEAVRQGCLCAPAENDHGNGWPVRNLLTGAIERGFYPRDPCPLHGEQMPEVGRDWDPEESEAAAQGRLGL